MNRLRIALLFFWLMTACTPLVPATTPPQLEQPPGTFVAVDDEIFDAGIFQVNYPDGWRVIKVSEAMAPVQVTFASPDDEMTITVSETSFVLPEMTLDASIYERREAVTRGDVTIYTMGRSPRTARETYDAIYDVVLESITVP